MASRGASFDAIRLLLDDRLPPAPSIPTLLTLHAFRSKQMVKVKAHELRSKNKTELKKQLDELKKELAILRVAKVTGGAASKLSKINVVKKSIARVSTVYSQQQKAALREHFAKSNSKYLPTDLRAKKTRAIRRRNPHADAKTLRQQKKDANFPARRYAVKN